METIQYVIFIKLAIINIHNLDLNYMLTNGRRVVDDDEPAPVVCTKLLFLLKKLFLSTSVLVGKLELTDQLLFENLKWAPI
jgi:hypothetical protein